MEHQEILWNGVTLLRADRHFQLGTDSVCCAAFSSFHKHSRVADLGCGSGALALMLLASDPTLQITGIELQQQAAEAAIKNAQHNNLQAQFQVLHGDLRQIRSLLPAGSMDGVISNPPYFPVGSGQRCTDRELAAARSEETCTLPQLTEAASWLLKWGGRFCLVHRPERLADLIWELRTQTLEPKRIRFVRHHAGAPVSLVLLEARKGGKPGLQYEQDLILFHENGEETAECRAVYHR